MVPCGLKEEQEDVEICLQSDSPVLSESWGDVFSLWQKPSLAAKQVIPHG